MFKKLSAKLRKTAADSSSELGDQDPAGGSQAASSETIDRVALFRLLLDNFTETEMMGLAQSLDVNYSQLASPGYGGKIRELIMYFMRRGRLSELLAACAQKRPDVAWGSVVSVTEAKTEPGAAVEPEPHQQLFALLTNHYDVSELIDLARNLGVRWTELKGSTRATKSKSLVVQLAEQDRLPELLEKMKALRPQVAPIQDLALPQVGQSESASAHQPARPSQVETTISDTADGKSDLYRLMVDQLSNREFVWICFDAGIDPEDLPGRILAHKARELLIYRGYRKQLDRLIAAGMIHRPDLNWLGASGMEVDETELPEVHHDGYKTAAIRSLLLSCFETYDDLDDFCQKHYPHIRSWLSITMSMEDNVQQLLGYCIRRSTADDLLNTIQELYPSQFGQFGPYTVN
jgi:hypothetical protein